MQVSKLWLCQVFVALSGTAVFAEDFRVQDIPTESCAELVTRSTAETIAAPTPVASLVAEAINRYCAGSGAIPMPDGLSVTSRAPSERSVDDPLEEATDEMVLVAEAAYYLEIAQQIDAGAANDLLRRLLGSEPKPK